ncbi:MAG: pantetheine-phosphate adenylyltransferase [Candidatus Firestonebacteria bacterium]|nr:pantetheine-phosphate adenylyltransferase [Candidatus Firestonebacteria bacterium]
MKTLAIYPGTFDPLTTGHLDLIHRACGLFSEVIVAVAGSTAKKPLFTAAERVAMIKQVTRNLPKVEVVSFSGLLVDFMRSRHAHLALRGLRAISDFEYEFQLAQMNRKLDPEFEIVYMMPDERYTYISSSLVKQVASLGGDVSAFVPKEIRPKLTAKFKRQSRGA